MKNNLILLPTLLALLMFSAFKAENVITIFMIGDSTMANKPLAGDNQERGWGHVLGGFFTEDIRVDNHAMNGRSSKSFIDEKPCSRIIPQSRQAPAQDPQGYRRYARSRSTGGLCWA